MSRLPPLGQVRDKVAETVVEVSPFHKYARRPGENYFRFAGGQTSLTIHTIGLGDVMIAKQFGRAFAAYLRDNGDPELGDIVLTNGGYAPKLTQDRGDHNLYWWYSFGPYDDRQSEFADEFLEPNLDVDPDLVLCGSERILAEAEAHGYDALSFPIGQYGFEPLGLDRSGLGYAGSEWHKSGEKIKDLLGRFRERPDFEWVSDLRTPDQLSLWYNTRLVTFGITKEGQRQWGVVNSRVFETLGTGTPLIIEAHPTLDDVLGFEYPYQVSSGDEAAAIVEEFTANPAETLAEFETYAQRIQRDHSYLRRIERLVEALD
jgi:hypothetical protein